ncbi:MAG TPA: hypothetical protein VLI71_09130, partial [Gammaproteobacteria bacterium]|nr:hypothetical protein [Gammaproteobacteria bacterium]
MDTFRKRLSASLRSSWIAALAALGLVGCSGSSGDSAPSTPPPSSSGTGTVLISLTDADGDFVGYS